VSLLTVAELRTEVRSSKTDVQLQAIIDRVEGIIQDRIGPYQIDDGSVVVTETISGGGEHLFLRVPIGTVTALAENGIELDEAEYRVWGQSGMIERLPEGAEWGATCTVSYKPVDQRFERKLATLNLVRLMLERTAMTSESIAGEYSYNAPEWDLAIKRELKNLSY
jgi:hypothetical protein